MFLKNYNTAYSYRLCGKVSYAKCNNVTFVGGTKLSSTTWTWTIHADYINSLMQTLPDVSYVGESKSSSSAGVIFGTGNAAPTVDDYTMSGNLISGLSASNVTYVSSCSVDDDSYHIKCVYTITNTTGADITIGEIGIVDYLSTKKTTSSTNYYYSYLIERTALEEPITIPANGVGQVTYEIILKAPCLPASAEES